ncbi:hypothetical protein AHF37_05915, partial [Paragonimus kellicotti]
IWKVAKHGLECVGVLQGHRRGVWSVCFSTHEKVIPRKMFNILFSLVILLSDSFELRFPERHSGRSTKPWTQLVHSSLPLHPHTPSSPSLLHNTPFRFATHLTLTQLTLNQASHTSPTTPSRISLPPSPPTPPLLSHRFTYPRCPTPSLPHAFGPTHSPRSTPHAGYQD